MFIESLLHDVNVDIHFLGKLVHVLVLLHQASALIVLAMPGDLRRGLGVQTEAERYGKEKEKHNFYFIITPLYSIPYNNYYSSSITIIKFLYTIIRKSSLGVN